jgi:hypothetical protein
VVADVVRREELINAMALDRTGSDASQMIGPIVGGVLLSRFDMGPAFAVIVAVYLVAALSAFMLRSTDPAPAPVAASMWRDLVEGGGYIRKNDAILALLLFAFLVNLVALPLTHGFMPIFARNVLNTGPLGLAALTSSVATGAFIGSFTLAARGRVARPGIFVVLAVLLWISSLLFFSQSSWLFASMAILLTAGVAQSISLVTVDTQLLRLPPAELRGRIMGVRSMAVYGLPMGLLMAGALADVLGAPLALGATAIGGAVMTALIAALLRGLWALR